MGSDRRFWILFGSIWIGFGLMLVASSRLLRSAAERLDFLVAAPEWLMPAIATAFALAGGAIIVWANVEAARVRRLIDTGIPLTATVLAIHRSRMEINASPRFRVRYRYEDVSGQTLEGESGLLRKNEAAAFRPGDRVAIKVDARNPLVSVLVGRG
jgi:uncharacterized protein DUF3592